MLARILQFFFPQRATSRTVRYAFPLMFAGAAFLGAQAISTQDVTSITVVPSTNALKAGETLELDIYVSANTPVNAVDLEIDIPSSQMNITGIDTGQSVITLWTEDPYYKNGTVFLRGGTFRRGFVGEHLIATVNAVATDSGVADIEITEYLLVAGDGTGNVVDVDRDNIMDSTVFIADENGSFEEAELSGRIAVTINTDVDSDGEVDLVDVSRFMAAWFDRDIIYDFNSDGTMSFADFSIILADSFRR